VPISGHQFSISNFGTPISEHHFIPILMPILNIPSIKVPDQMDVMAAETDKFAGRCKKMPKVLRDWEAYRELKKEIEDFSEALPLLVELAKKSIQSRHWAQVLEYSKEEI
jgi:hypothetical protein